MVRIMRGLGITPSQREERATANRREREVLMRKREAQRRDRES
jgi:hypothetical protein